MLARATAQSVDPKVIQPMLEAHVLTLEELEDRAPSDADYASYWGPWQSREEEFYLACAARAQHVGPAEFARRVDGTPEGQSLLARLDERYDAITNAGLLPTHLVRAGGMKTRDAGKNVVLTSYNRFYPLSLEKELYEVLAMLDESQTLAENLARLDRDHGIQLAPELLRYLRVHGIRGAFSRDRSAPLAARPAVSSAPRPPISGGA